MKKIIRIYIAIIVHIVPKIVVKSIFFFKNIALKIKAEEGTKNIKELTSFVPNFVIPIKYIDVAKVVLKILTTNIFNQKI